MLKDITGIRLLGANFDKVTDILMLDTNEGNTRKNVKGCLLYGRNGAGKSTLAKAIKKAKGEIQDSIIQSEFLDINNSPIVLNEEENARVFVFDEEYIDKNIKFREEGLDTIIMVGHQVKLEDEIKDKKNKLEKVENDLVQKKEILSKIENSECKESPSYYLKKMRSSLQGNSSWAGRDKTIKGNRQNTKVGDDTYKQFIELSTQKTRDELVIEFDNKLKKLQIAQKGDEIISEKVPILNIDYDESEIARLLETRIEKPLLSAREKYLLGLVQAGKTEQLTSMVDTFSNKEVHDCPYCAQPVSDEYKENLVQSIQKILSKEVEKHQTALKSFKREEIIFDFSPYAKLKTNCESCINLLSEINNSILYNNSIIQSKIDNPYNRFKYKIKSINVLLNQLNLALELLEHERIKYNKNVTATQPIINELNRINGHIAYYDIKDDYNKYLACIKQESKEREKFSKLQAEFNKVTQDLDELEAKQKNVKIALSIINHNLSYIFFSSERFRIEYKNNNYVLLSNGKSVCPSQISQGERNIIGLCYFFASILQNQEKNIAYTKDYLLVIDDPISSFDIENRTGIMSFLRYQLGKFLLGNIDTRAIIMTHDLLTFYDSGKIFDELTDGCKSKYNINFIYKQYELKNKTLIWFSYKSRQEYTELLKIVYNFASGDVTHYNLIIGNIMRQVLEAFSTFQYKKGIDKISTDRGILDLLPDVYQTYFENLMYRLILNNGSHKLDQTKSMYDMNFFAVISESEKQRTAKEILCFIYLLNKKHLLCHLDGCRDVEQNLTQWCYEIKCNAGA